MKLLVPVKRVLDYSVKVGWAQQARVKADKSAVDLAGVKMSMNPFCEIAMEESIRIRERTKDRVSEIVALTIGPKQ